MEDRTAIIAVVIILLLFIVFVGYTLATKDVPTREVYHNETVVKEQYIPQSQCIQIRVEGSENYLLSCKDVN